MIEMDSEVQVGSDSSAENQATGGETTQATQESAPAAPPEKSFREKLAEKAAKNGISMDDSAPKAEETVEPKKTEKPAKTSVSEQKTGEKPAAATETPAVFTPNPKFKVMDKEHDVPDYLKAAMKDPESEKAIREMLEKAYGLDIVKPRFAEAREQFKAVQNENTAMKADISDLKQTYARGDLDSFFNKLNIPQEKILQYVLNKIEYSQLPPDQQRVLDEQKSAERRAWEAESRAGQVEERFHEQAVQAKQTALEFGLARPDVQSVAKSFDERVGRSGAFKEAVIHHGQLAWFQSNGKNDLSPEQAIQAVMTTYGLSAQAAASAVAAAPTGAAQEPASGTQAPAVVTKPQVNVLPNVSGRGTSPMPQRAKSISDLKKKYEELSKG